VKRFALGNGSVGRSEDDFADTRDADDDSKILSFFFGDRDLRQKRVNTLTARLSPSMVKNHHLALFLLGTSLTLFGYFLSCLPQIGYCLNAQTKEQVDCVTSPHMAAPPFIQPSLDRPVSMFTMSQRAATVSYTVTASGLCVFVYYICFILTDCVLLWSSFLYELSIHALLVFVIRDFPLDAAHSMWPPMSPWWSQCIGQLQVMLYLPFGKI
jgi:hypothetical protein